MARRTGVPSILQVATRLCDLMNRYAPLIVSLYPSNTALQAALAAAQAACSTLSVELEQVREYGD